MAWTRWIARTGVTALVILCAVFMLFAGIFAATGEAPAAMVFRPPGSPASLPDGVKLLRWGSVFAVVRGVSPDYVRKLYASGAILVLPYRKSGCLAYRPA